MLRVISSSVGVGIGSGVAVGARVGVGVGIGVNVAVGAGARVGDGVGSEVAAGVGLGVSVGLGARVGTGDGITVGSGVGVGLASMVAASLASIVASMSRVGDGVTVGTDEGGAVVAVFVVVHPVNIPAATKATNSNRMKGAPCCVGSKQLATVACPTMSATGGMGLSPVPRCAQPSEGGFRLLATVAGGCYHGSRPKGNGIVGGLTPPSGPSTASTWRLLPQFTSGVSEGEH